MFTVRGKHGEAIVFSEQKDEKAIEQIRTLMDQPFVAGAQVRIMPDYHWGAGCTIGFTADLGDYIVPNLVGVDIGCGMLAVDLGARDRPFDWRTVDRIVHEIPSGFQSWKTPLTPAPEMRELICYPNVKTTTIDTQVGTLGGGNHFIEFSDDEQGHYWLVIHSGSRNIGLQVAEYYQKLAVKTCPADVPRDLKYLSGDLAAQYLHDMQLCQRYAWKNREEMGGYILEKLTGEGLEAYESFQTVHNYIDPEDHVIRKGAVRADKGRRLLIPFNMRDGSLIAIGKGNAEWNESAPHGAGRLMGRNEARRRLDLNQFERQMKDVYTTTVSRGTLDEAPDAYKPVEEILAAIGDTVEIQTRLRPLYNFKAGR